MAKLPHVRIPVQGSSQFKALVERTAAATRISQQRIGNQIDSINRLLASSGAGWQYTDEMGVLHETLATAQAELAEMKEQLMGRKKDAFMAGFEAGETVEDKDAAWKDYKQELEDAEPEPTED